MSQEPNKKNEVESESESEILESFIDSPTLSFQSAISEESVTDEHNTTVIMRQKPNKENEVESESESEILESFHDSPTLSYKSTTSEESVTDEHNTTVIPSNRQQDITDKTLPVQAPAKPTARESMPEIDTSDEPALAVPLVPEIAKEYSGTEAPPVSGVREGGKKFEGRKHKSHKTNVYAEVPADRGFAWFMVCMTFFAHFMVDGTLYSNSVLMPFIAEDLGHRPALVFLIKSFQVGSFYFSIPFTCAIINYYGCRIVSIVGVVIVVISLLISSIASYIIIIMFFYGILGLGMISISSQIVIAYHFTKFRSIAAGISSSGAGAGVMIFSYVNFKLVGKFGWRVNTQVNAALMSFILLPSLAYKQLLPTKIAEMTKESDSETEVEENLILHTDPIEKQDILFTGPPQFKERDNSSHIDLAGVDAKVGTKDRDTIRNIHHALSMSNMTKEGQENLKLERRRKSLLLDFVLRSSYFPKKIAKAFALQFKIRLFNMSEFVVLLLSAIFYSAGCNIPYVFSVERSKHLHSVDRNMILAFIGMVDTVIRYSSGFISYKFVNQVTYIFGGGIFLAGLVTFMSGVYSDANEYVQLFYSGGFAIAPAFHNTLRTVVYVRFLGIDNLTALMGLSYLGMSAGVTAGTSLGTFYYGMTDDLSGTFMLAGVCLMTAGILPLLIPIFVKQIEEKIRRMEA